MFTKPTLPAISLGLASIVTLLGLAGCVDQPHDEGSQGADEPAAAEPVVVDAAVRVEQAERALDVGRDVAGAKATLQAVALDKTAPVDVRDRAAMSLSRALEILKDQEGAIGAVEALLAAHGDDPSWPGQDAADRRLRKLLTGKDQRPEPARAAAEKASKMAKALADFFPAKKDAPVEVSILAFGGDSQVSDQHGTFQIGAALREKAQEACPLCEAKVNVRTSSSRSGSWTAIPAARGRMTSSLVVFYTHLADPIPARYDALLPVPMAEVTAHLEKGEAVVVAKQRPGAPPVLLLAAPREAQLADVEEALAQRTSLPTSLEVIKVTANLKPHEIQGVVRAQMPAFRACYEGLLGRAPAAAGKITLGFTIQGDGSIAELSVAAEGAVDEGAMTRCVTDAAGKLRFDATGATSTVKYPIAFSP